MSKGYQCAPPSHIPYSNSHRHQEPEGGLRDHLSWAFIFKRQTLSLKTYWRRDNNSVVQPPVYELLDSKYSAQLFLPFGNTLQYSCLENSMDWGAWYITVQGVAKSRTRLSYFTFFLSLVYEGQLRRGVFFVSLSEFPPTNLMSLPFSNTALQMGQRASQTNFSRFLRSSFSVRFSDKVSLCGI